MTPTTYITCKDCGWNGAGPVARISSRVGAVFSCGRCGSRNVVKDIVQPRKEAKP